MRASTKKSAAIFIFALICDAAAKFAAVESGIAILNSGVAFSIASGCSRLPTALSLASVVALTSIYALMPSARGSVGVALMAAGALGNLIDRYIYGYVVDWVPVMGMSWNFADVYLCAGGAMIMIAALRERRRQSGE